MRGFLIAFLAWVLMSPAAGMAQQPGTLIAYEPVAEAPPGAQAWRIRYVTTDDDGVAIIVGGTVVAPREAIPARERPVVAWAHGTWGVASNCIPATGDIMAGIPGLDDAIGRGMTIVAPDYAGFGDAADAHPYLVGPIAAHAVLDAVRAAREIPGAGSGGRFAVWGESQGGHAALWTAQLARAYAPDLTLVGAAAAAPPTTLADNLTAGSDPSVRAMLTAFTAYSWSQHYGVPLTGLGNRQTRGIIERLARNNCVRLDASPRLGAVLGVLALRRDLRGVDLGRVQPWAGFARRNSPAARDHGVPILIAQNPSDTIVAPAVTRAFARQLCRRRVAVRWVDLRGEGHVSSGRDSAIPALDWIAAMFAGASAPSDCAII